LRRRVIESRAPRKGVMPRVKRERAAKPRRRAAAARRKPGAPGPAAPPDPARDISPSRYIARLSRRTGKELPGPIEPDELLVHAHRDQHPAEVVAQFLGSRLVQLTGREGLVEGTLRRVNALGAGAAELIGGAVGSPAVEKAAKRLLGGVDRDTQFKVRGVTPPG